MDIFFLLVMIRAVYKYVIELYTLKLCILAYVNYSLL